jgi:hypothetical protein
MRMMAGMDADGDDDNKHNDGGHDADGDYKKNDDGHDADGNDDTKHNDGRISGGTTSLVPCSGGGELARETKGWIDDNQIRSNQIRWIPCLPVREPLIVANVELEQLLL